MQGYKRIKTRPQAESELKFRQDAFGGGLNSDTPATKITKAEMAVLDSCVAFPEYLTGHWGRKLFSEELLPGTTGTKNGMAQHPKTGRWLVHRGDKLWLSEGRAATDWTEVTVIGPDGSLEAAASFTNGAVTISGAVGSYISAMVLAGVTPGQTVYLQAEATGGAFVVRVYSNVGMTTLIASGSISDATVLPAPVALAQSGGSGVSGTVSMDVNPTGAVRTGSGVVATKSVTFTLHGLTEDNTDDFDLYWKVVVSGADVTLTIYKDAAKTLAVASSVFIESAVSPPEIQIDPLNDSGISGSHTWNNYVLSNGTYNGTAATFTPADAKDIDAKSTEFGYTEDGFIVFVRGANNATQHNIYVDQTLERYWFLSIPEGYGALPMADAGSGEYVYRYLYTFSRIVDPVTMEPAYDENRLTANLTFEGPSNKNLPDQTDYSTQLWVDPVDVDHPFTVGLVDSDGVPVGINAPSYITHISAYRTLDVGVNGIGLNGAANNSEIYIWVKDVPIYNNAYTEEISDTVLRNRFAGGSTQGENFALRSRFFREMSRGIGAIRTDFMATAVPQSQTVTYCELSVVPRLIGYHYPGTQRFLTDDPVSEITATEELFVVLTPTATYTSITDVNAETGISGINPIPVIQNFKKASKTLGIKYGQGVFQVDESSFVTLLSDGTVRIFSAASWGAAIDGTKVHMKTQLAATGAVFALIQGVLLMWYTEDPDADATDKCLRFGSGDLAGNGWCTVNRENWVFPPIWCGALVVEDDDSLIRLAVVNYVDNAIFGVEDSGAMRQYEDDIISLGPTVNNLYFNQPILVGEPDRTRYYCVAVYVGSGNYTIYGYATEADRTGGDPGDRIFEGDVTFTTAVNGYELLEANTSGISGTIDILSTFPFGDLEDVDFEILTAYMAAVTSQADIPSILRPRELTGEDENFMSFHQESHVIFRPIYGDTSLPDGLEFTAYGYADGAAVAGAETLCPAENFDIQFFARVEGNQIQNEYVTNKSRWRITSTNTKLQSHDMQAAEGPWNSLEAGYQFELAQGKKFWLSKYTFDIDRATGLQLTGGPVTATNGPGSALDGIVIPSGQAITTAAAMAAVVGDFSLFFWVYNPPINAAADVITVGAKPMISFNSSTSIQVGMTGDSQRTLNTAVGAYWTHFAIIRTSGVIKVYQNGVQVGAVINDSTNIGGSAVMLGNAIGACAVADPWVCNAAISEAALLYYYRDIVTNEGKRVLP